MWRNVLKFASKPSQTNQIVKKGKETSKMNNKTKPVKYSERRKVKPLTEKSLTEKPKYNDMPLL